MWSLAVIIITFPCCLVSAEAEGPRYAIRRGGDVMHGRYRRVLGWNYPIRNQRESQIQVASSLSEEEVVFIKPTMERPQLRPVAAPHSGVPQTSKHVLPRHDETLPRHDEDFALHAKASPKLAQKMEAVQQGLYKKPNELILKHMQKVIERLDVIKVTANPRIQHLYSLLKDELHHQQPHSYLPDQEARKYTFVNRLDLFHPDSDRQKRRLYASV